MSILFLERTLCCKVKTDSITGDAVQNIFGKNIMLYSQNDVEVVKALHKIFGKNVILYSQNSSLLKEPGLRILGKNAMLYFYL